jgi:hypothetical protein
MPARAKAKPTMLTVTFTKVRETKGTFVYGEDETDEPVAVGTLYVKKAVASVLGDPESITVTIEAS